MVFHLKFCNFRISDDTADCIQGFRDRGKLSCCFIKPMNLLFDRIYFGRKFHLAEITSLRFKTALGQMDKVEHLQ